MVQSTFQVNLAKAPRSPCASRWYSMRPDLPISWKPWRRLQPAGSRLVSTRVPMSWDAAGKSSCATLAAIPILTALLALSSCILGGAKTPKTPVVPAALDPNAAAKPAAPAPPLSSPQTEIQLPPAQTVSAEALATIQQPVPPAPE